MRRWANPAVLLFVCAGVCGTVSCGSDKDMTTASVPGTWVVQAAETRRPNLAGRVFDDLMADIVGASVYCYPAGVVRIVLRDGSEGSGYLFLDEPAGTVTIWVDERVGLLDRLPLVAMRPTAGGTLTLDDGTSKVVLRRVGASAGALPASLEGKAKLRPSVSLLQLLRDGTTAPAKGGGEEHAPGIQGESGQLPE